MPAHRTLHVLIQNITYEYRSVTFTENSCTSAILPHVPPSTVHTGSSMPPRRTIATVLLLLVILHLYIGFRLIPAIAPGIAGGLLGIVLLVVSTLLVPTGLLSPYFKRRRGAEQLAW